MMPDFKLFDQETYDERTRVQRLRIKRTRKGRLLRITFCFLAIMALLSWAVFTYADGVWTYLTDKYFNGRINVMASEDLATDNPRRLNIMLVGMDQRAGEPARSDTLILAMFNLQDKAIIRA
jgi:anionic cell wall polymer biosynthesis LytR-Cps2A-Psr (LCP) family protein